MRRIVVCALLAAAVDGALTPATKGTLVKGFETSFDGKGGAHVSEAVFEKDQGNVTMGSQVFGGVVYQHQAWDGYDLMNVFSMRRDGGNVAVVYAYCQGGKVVALYSEDFTQEMVEESASGSCSYRAATDTMQVTFPPLTALPSPTPSVAHITVTGPSLNITNGLGAAAFGGSLYNVTVFSHVNCAQCGQGGWYELHSFLYSPTLQKGCFTIFYLMFSSHQDVSMEYTMCIPDLSQPEEQFGSAWQGSMPSEDITPSAATFHQMRRQFLRK